MPFFVESKNIYSFHRILALTSYIECISLAENYFQHCWKIHLKRCIVSHWIDFMLLERGLRRTIAIVTQTGRERVEWRVELRTTWMPWPHLYGVICIWTIVCSILLSPFTKPKNPAIFECIDGQYAAQRQIRHFFLHDELRKSFRIFFFFKSRRMRAVASGLWMPTYDVFVMQFSLVECMHSCIEKQTKIWDCTVWTEWMIGAGPMTNRDTKYFLQAYFYLLFNKSFKPLRNLANSHSTL